MAREVAAEAVPVAEEARAVAVVPAEVEVAALVALLPEQKVTFIKCKYRFPHLLEVPVNTIIRSY